MTQHFQVLLEWDSEDEVWVTHVPILNSLSTFGATREEALANTREAIEGYLEAGTLRAILRQSGLSAEELTALL